MSMTTATPSMTNPELRDIWDYGRNAAESEKAVAILAERNQVDPCGKPFVWGTVTHKHEVGDILIIESVRDESYHGRPPGEDKHREVQPEEDAAPRFHGYVRIDEKWIDTGHSHDTLEEAVVHDIAFRHLTIHEGINSWANNASRAATFFMRSIGAKGMDYTC